jgi:hypothetical protein
MEDTDLSPENSLNLISRMIQQAKGNIQNNSFYFLLWGWAIAMVNISIFFLLTLTDLSISEANMVWFVTVPIGIIYLIRAYQRGRSEGITTPITVAIGWLWMAYSITIITIIAFGRLVNFQINPLILLFTALPTLLTGKMIRFKPLMLGGFSFWISCIVCFLVPFTYQYLVAGIGIAVGFIIPSHLLKNKKDFDAL